jgi:Domain of unknown function (DUF397)
MSSPVWRKSSRSNAQGGDCVEVAVLPRPEHGANSDTSRR